MNWYRSKECLHGKGLRKKADAYANVSDVMSSYEEILDLMKFEDSFPKTHAAEMLEEMAGEVKNLIADNPAYEAFGYYVLGGKDPGSNEWALEAAWKILPSLSQTQLLEFAEYFESEPLFNYALPTVKLEDYLSSRGIEHGMEEGTYIDVPETPAPGPSSPVAPAEPPMQQPPQNPGM